MRVVVLNIGSSQFSDTDCIREYLHLAQSNGYEVCYVYLASVKKPSPKTYVHSGAVASLKSICADLQPDMVVCSIALSARIQRNLEKALCVNVVDRTELILSLFEKRATSSAGKCQVELARLSYMQTKLVRGWTHLERQRGGIGLRGGPGETQIEVDRRILRDNIHKTKHKLDKLVKTRRLNRQRRQSTRPYVVALVGYTNAGKSTLFNLLTQSTAWANDQLFATLDPLVRRVRYPGLSTDVVLVDTVGFMRDLPEPLVTAFHSTLEEITHSDLILHIVDCADPELHHKKQSVNDALTAISAQDIPSFTVYNKADLNPDFSVLADGDCMVSSTKNTGIESLVQRIAQYCQRSD